jgi:hypothetical protein
VEPPLQSISFPQILATSRACARREHFLKMLRLFSILLLFVELSTSQKDPLQDFCRRFGHQASVVDQKLYIDGGLVDWNPISQNDQNYTSELGFLSISKSTVHDISSAHFEIKLTLSARHMAPLQRPYNKPHGRWGPSALCEPFEELVDPRCDRRHIMGG